MKKTILLLLALGGSVINAGFEKTNHVGLAQDANTRYEGRMEDRFIADTNIEIFGVFDGHAGQSCAEYIVNGSKYCGTPRLTMLIKKFQQKGFDDGTALTKSFAILEKRLWEKRQETNEYGYQYYNRFVEQEMAEIYGNSGTTALVAKKTENILTLANVGDSRAVLIRDSKIVQTTIDHKPNLPQEKTRIEKAGGKIKFYGCWRVGGLALSRSLGDVFLKEGLGQIKNDLNQIVSAVPDIYKWNTKPGDLLILATDGLWDVMDKEPNDNAVLQEIVDEMASCNPIKTTQEIADLLCKKAKALGSKDNITVLTVQF